MRGKYAGISRPRSSSHVKINQTKGDFIYFIHIYYSLTVDFFNKKFENSTPVYFGHSSLVWNENVYRMFNYLLLSTTYTHTTPEIHWENTAQNLLIFVLWWLKKRLVECLSIITTILDQRNALATIFVSISAAASGVGSPSGQHDGWTFGMFFFGNIYHRNINIIT